MLLYFSTDVIVHVENFWIKFWGKLFTRSRFAGISDGVEILPSFSASWKHYLRRLECTQKPSPQRMLDISFFFYFSRANFYVIELRARLQQFWIVEIARLGFRIILLLKSSNFKYPRLDDILQCFTLCLPGKHLRTISSVTLLTVLYQNLAISAVFSHVSGCDLLCY